MESANNNFFLEYRSWKLNYGESSYRVDKVEPVYPLQLIV